MIKKYIHVTVNVYSSPSVLSNNPEDVRDEIGFLCHVPFYIHTHLQGQESLLSQILNFPSICNSTSNCMNSMSADV